MLLAKNSPVKTCYSATTGIQKNVLLKKTKHVSVLLLMSTQETKRISEVMAEKEFLITSTSLVIFQRLVILACHCVRIL